MAATILNMPMFFFFFFLLLVCSQLAFAHSAVKFLPGFEGPLPFELETGYVGVGDSEDVQLFYYFIKSERKPEDDPLLLWLTGGPGCSAFCGLVFEIGPLKFEVAEYNGSLPTLVLNPYSWTKASNIIFVDSPVGTGFSYARNRLAERTSDTKQAGHLHQFLLKWLKDHADFISNPIYVGGDSYAGIPAPVLVQEILNGNEQGIEPIIDLQGYILGNPVTGRGFEENFRIPFAHGMGLISGEHYESLERNCNAEYQNVDPNNQACREHVQYFHECTSRINNVHILEPNCGFDSSKPRNTGRMCYLDEHRQQLLHDDPSNEACLKDIQYFDECTSRINNAHILELDCGLDSPKPRNTGRMCYLDDQQQQLLHDEQLPPLFCRVYAAYLSHFWANDDNVQIALHIRKGSIGTWQRCNFGLPYNKDVPTSFPYHANLSTRGCRALIYSGDHDLMVPYLGTQEWIRLLNHSIVDDWRPWMVQGQVAGYTRTYSNRMTFATVKGAGHTAPEYKPPECFAMFDRWISGQPL